VEEESGCDHTEVDKDNLYMMEYICVVIVGDGYAFCKMA
jgi:hypothetical protein